MEQEKETLEWCSRKRRG